MHSDADLFSRPSTGHERGMHSDAGLYSRPSTAPSERLRAVYGQQSSEMIGLPRRSRLDRFSVAESGVQTFDDRYQTPSHDLPTHPRFDRFDSGVVGTQSLSDPTYQNPAALYGSGPSYPSPHDDIRHFAYTGYR